MDFFLYWRAQQVELLPKVNSMPSHLFVLFCLFCLCVCFFSSSLKSPDLPVLFPAFLGSIAQEAAFLARLRELHQEQRAQLEGHSVPTLLQDGWVSINMPGAERNLEGDGSYESWMLLAKSDC